MDIFNHDVLVVGAGIAGEMAALELARRGKKVAILSKTQPSLSHSRFPEGGINVSLGAGDDWLRQAQDIWNDGHFLSDWDALETACRESPKIMRDEFLDLLDRAQDGTVRAYDHAGTSRSVKSGSYTGLNLLRKIQGELSRYAVPVLSDRHAMSLITMDGECRGVTALNLLTGELEGHSAQSVILCTGGFGYLYEHTAHDSSLSGDGQALAYKAGAALKDMEFIRFHHFIVYGSHAAVTEGAFRKGCHLYNKDDQRFLAKYEPELMENVDTFYLKRYIQLEIDSGNAVEDKYVWLDFRHLGEAYIDQELPRTRRVCLDALNLDIVRDRVPVVPGVFATLGGIAVDIDGRTSVPGLYSAGECACTGLHGADWRLGNTLLAAIVFGKRAGAAASDGAKGNGNNNQPDDGAVRQAVQTETLRLDGITARRNGMRHGIVRATLRFTMTQNSGTVRDAARLEQALQTVRDLKGKYESATLWDNGIQFNRELLGFLQLGNMLLLGEAVVHAALARKESRGAHWRSDFPDRDDNNWLRHSLQSYGDSGPSLSYAPVKLGPFQPQETVMIR